MTPFLLGHRPEDAAGRARGNAEVGHLPERPGQLCRESERIVNWLQAYRDSGKAGERLTGDAVQQAAQLAKTDLTTELVKEFTELQGIVGGLYARRQGLPETVADAIYDQYKPESIEDSAPRTLEGAVLSIADKADSIAGMFALGLVPSGRKTLSRCGVRRTES